MKSLNIGVIFFKIEIFDESQMGCSSRMGKKLRI